MKRRNPLFVAGLPYTTTFVAYFGLIFFSPSQEGSTLSGQALALFIFWIFVALIGSGYFLYWLLVTAKTLQQETHVKIPNGMLLIIPFASYWWMWRYGQAAEKYTHNKAQGVLVFILLALLGSIGAGVMQDYYNKQSS